MFPHDSTGGFLGATGDYYLGARISVVGSLLSVIITFFIPSGSGSIDEKQDIKNSNGNDLLEVDERSTLTATHESDSSPQDSGKYSDADSPTSSTSLRRTSIVQSALNQVSTIAGVVKIVWLLLSLKIISSVANSMMSETFPLILKNIFKLNEQSLGLAIAANSAFNGVVNGLFLAPMVAYSGGDLLRVITLCLFFMTCLALSLSAVAIPSLSPFTLSPLSAIPSLGPHGLHGYLTFTFILSIFQYALSTTITGQSTSMVKKTQKGTLLGVEHSFFALARVVAPQVGVSLLQGGGITAVTAASGSIYLLMLSVWNMFKFSLKGPSKSQYKNGKESGYSAVDRVERNSTGERKGK
jgi:hypothetical protein